LEQNVGQADPSIGYLLRAGSMKVGLGAGELTYVLTGPSVLTDAGSVAWRPSNPEQSAAGGGGFGWTVRQELVGASKAMPNGTVGSPTTVSYFRGGPEQWLVSVPAYQQVAYTEAWPGITVTYDQAAGGLKSAYHVAPGADPALVHRGAGAPGRDRHAGGSNAVGGAARIAPQCLAGARRHTGDGPSALRAAGRVDVGRG